MIEWLIAPLNIHAFVLNAVTKVLNAWGGLIRGKILVIWASQGGNGDSIRTTPGQTVSCCGSGPSARQSSQGGTLAETLAFPRLKIFVF
ncbi:hypothetical protein HG530_003012 [Fusarium avenaceum]|nr:hypothetical protein HG530_003012 [Fusarium avenaceum]